MTKAEIIQQFSGFGNKVQASNSEHFLSSGFFRSPNGFSANKYVKEWYEGNTTAYPQTSGIGIISSFAFGLGDDQASSGSDQNYYLYANDSGRIYESLEGTGTPQLIYDGTINSSIYGQSSIIVDQKKRLLIAGKRYLGKLETAEDSEPFSLSLTNGSDVVTATFGTFTSGMVGKRIRVFVGAGVYHYYRIQTFNSSSEVEIYGSFSGTTGSYSAYVLNQWYDSWKDFGTTIDSDSEGNDYYSPMETYEDTVLIGRLNNIVTLDTTTDTATTDGSPSFNLPDGYEIRDIHKGANGILIGANVQRKGVLVLWDNYSDRSIAPWIELNDRLLSVAKYNGGWIVVTTKEILYTNGYSITPWISDFLDSEVSNFASGNIPQNSVIIGDTLFISLDFSGNGKRRAGLYGINLATKLCEYYPMENLDSYNSVISALFYVSSSSDGRLFVGKTGGFDYVLKDNETPVSKFYSSPVGEGENFKYAEALKCFLNVSQTDTTKQSPYTFTITAKICPMDEQLFNLSQVKTTMTDLSEVVVDESTYHVAKVGDEIEFLEGESAGYTRNITAISGSGTATATYTLDRALPVLVSANKKFFITPFRLIKSKTYTDVTKLPEVWFDIKNRIKAKKYMVKIEIEDADFPIEIKPSLFIYDDLGIY